MLVIIILFIFGPQPLPLIRNLLSPILPVFLFIFVLRQRDKDRQQSSSLSIISQWLARGGSEGQESTWAVIFCLLGYALAESRNWKQSCDWSPGITIWSEGIPDCILAAASNAWIVFLSWSFLHFQCCKILVVSFSLIQKFLASLYSPIFSEEQVKLCFWWIFVAD